MQPSNNLLFGTAYYPEYQGTSHLEEDMSLMRQAHMNVIRVGEGSWSHWEPEDGVFNLDWLEPTLNAALSNGIHAIIGVPTFAIPQWLVRKYPEVALHDDHGKPMPFGWREEHDYSHAAYRFYAERVIRKIVGRYASHPAVIGWQLHNEPGYRIDTSPSIFEGFKDYLRQRYGSIKALNEAWGLVFWSHELSTWDDLWRPEGNCQPQYDIEWRRYQYQLTNQMLHWQRECIEELCRDDQFITVNMALGRTAFDESLSSSELDVASSDIYYQAQDGLNFSNQADNHLPWLPTGSWQISLLSDRTFAVKQRSFLVAETNGGPIGGSADMYPPYPGQLRMAAWQMIARGARMIEYWQWRQLPFGTEMYWGSVLPHDGKPGRSYQEIAALGQQIREHEDVLQGLMPDYDIAMLYSVDSRAGLSYEPPIAQDISQAPHRTRNENAYDQIFESFYRGVFFSGHQARILFDSQLVDIDGPKLSPAKFCVRYPVMIVAGLYLCSDEMQEWLIEYVHSGGHLILGPRSLYADPMAVARADVQPAGLSTLAQADYQESSKLDCDLPVTATGLMPLRNGSCATEWIDCLRNQGADTLVGVDHPFFSGFSAVTSATAGSGRVTLVGTVPNIQLAASILDWALPSDEWANKDQEMEGHVTHASAHNADNQRIHWYFNWGWRPSIVSVPGPYLPSSCKGKSPTEKPIELGPWDVKMVIEAGINSSDSVE